MNQATDPKDRSHPAVEHAHHIETPAEALERVDTHPVGAGVGAVSGAAVGAVAGLAAGPLGSLAGAVVGGLAGGLIGSGGTASGPAEAANVPTPTTGDHEGSARSGGAAAPGHEDTTLCPSCGGTGLLGDDFEVCLMCRGTGHVAHGSTGGS